MALSEKADVAPLPELAREPANGGHGDARDVLEGYRLALLIRGVERRLLDLFSTGKLYGTVHTCIGQEWSAVALARALRAGDVVFAPHRCHGHYLARTDDVEGLVAEIMGKPSGPCGGRGGSQHLCADGFYSSGVQGGIAPVAAGVALARRLRGDGHIAVVVLGDGTLGEGVVYESFNLASKWQLPVLFLLENNGYAQSTPQAQTLAGDVRARAEAFGIPTREADTWDPPRLLEQIRLAADAVRRDGSPVFLLVNTFRLAAHSKGDDDRDPRLIQSYWDRDAVARFEKERPREAAEIHAAVDARIAAAVARAEAEPFAAGERETPRATREPRWSPVRIDNRERVAARIHAALAAALERDPRVVLIGEDIEAPYGGAFKVTRDLSRRFPGRVRNTPISEAAIVGLGNGLALAGLRPVCEIMFGDFLALAADQIINHAAKFAYMFNEQVRVPLVVRTPMGGKRGYGPTHSQSLEKHFLGLPGTQVLALHHRYDPARVYDTLFETIDRPTLVIENKLLYGLTVAADAPAGFALEQDDGPYPTVRLRPRGTPDVTVVCYGGVLADAERAADRLFDEFDLICEVVCPLRLYPLDLQPIAESVRRTGRLLVVEEGHGFAAFGSELVAQLCERVAGRPFRVRRLYAPEHPIPSCKPLELALLPGEAHVIEAVREIVQDA